MTTGAEDLEILPFNFAQGRLSAQDDNTRGGLEILPFDFAQGRLTQDDNPKGNQYQSSARSSHRGFKVLINAFFFSRRQRLSCFSRAIASLISR